jgi:hypothetical protein
MAPYKSQSKYKDTAIVARSLACSQCVIRAATISAPSCLLSCLIHCMRVLYDKHCRSSCRHSSCHASPGSQARRTARRTTWSCILCPGQALECCSTPAHTCNPPDGTRSIPLGLGFAIWLAKSSLESCSPLYHLPPRSRRSTESSMARGA